MELIKLISEVRQMSDSEAKKFAKTYGVSLSEKEIRRLRPLLDQFSFHWLLMGVPASIMQQVEQILGYERTYKIIDHLKQYK